MAKFHSGRLRSRLDQPLLRRLLSLAIVLCCCAIATGGGAQTPDTADVPANSEAAPVESPENLITHPLQNWTPPAVGQIFEADDDIDRAAVDLDGRVLFDVASPVDDASALSAPARARKIEVKLRQIAEAWRTTGNLDTLTVAHENDPESNQPIIYVNDQMLMTVTYLDARAGATNSLDLRARQIVDDVKTALVQYYRERQPDFLWQQVRWTLATLLITLLSSFAISHFAQKLRARRRRLQHEQLPPGSIDSVQPSQLSSVNRIRSTLLTKQQINGLAIARQMLQVLQVVLWAGSSLLILGFFPYSRWLQPLIVDLMRVPVRFIIVGLIAYGLIRLANLWIDRLFLVFQGRTAAHLERSQRLVLRLSTFSQVIKGIIDFLIAGIALLVMLSFLGLRVTPLLAGAGLIGFAISFASQSLIKDIINGFLVLIEDQYGVGDVITVGSLSGFVETMNLRITQLRATDGQLITIPNGQINIVQNLSKEWSRVDLMIPVGLTADINQALHLVEQEADNMRQDEIWGPLILEPPLLLGVDDLSHVGATIRIWIKTQPLKQWDVAREYRRRLKIAFEIAQIPLGIPQQVVQVAGPHAPSRQLIEANGKGSEGVSEPPIAGPMSAGR
ncbi:MAG: mechanosensitive ion channel family protein [Cyanobacteria bacterium P01_C01_bin.120]